MCIFITVITKASDKDVASKILVNAGRRAELIDNPSLRAAIAEDEIQLLTTNGHCDCGTVLGDEPSNEQNDEALKTEIRKLRRKKWSEAKIGRYLEDRDKAKEKRDRSRQDQGGDSVELWSDIFSTALCEGATRVGLFYRMYSGSIVSEVFEPKKVEIKFRDFQNADFRTLNENKVYYFV